MYLSRDQPASPTTIKYTTKFTVSRGPINFLPPFPTAIDLQINLNTHELVRSSGLCERERRKAFNGTKLGEFEMVYGPLTIFLLIFALLSGTAGLCWVFQGYLQARVWNSVGLANAAISAIISLGITALDFGLLCKPIIVGGHRCKRLQTLVAFIAISGLSQIFYLLLLHAGVFNCRYGPTYQG